MKLNQDLIQRMFDGRGGVAGGGSSLDPGLINGLATEMWTEENYVSKTFFNELFIIHKKTTTTVYDGDTVVSTTTDTSGTFAPNEIPSQEESTDSETGYRTVVVTEVDNIEAKKGLWTDFFLSALGLNGSGGGGGIGDVTWQALGDNTDTRQIASSHLTTALSSALAGYATQSWVTSQNYVTSSAISDMATKTWVNNQSFVNWTALGDTTTTQQIALSHLTTALSGYATQTWVTNNFSTPSSVATQMQTYAKIQNGTITIGDTSLTPITSVTGTFWGKSFTNGGTVNGTIKAGSNGGAIEQFHSMEMNSAGTLAGYGGFIDFHYYATGSTFDSTLDYTSRIIESEVGVISILAKNNNATNANKLAALLVGAGYDGSYIQIGDLRIVYDSTNNALKVVKLVSGSEVAANFYATGSVSALGYGSGGGGGTGDVTWTNLADNTDTRQIALSHLTGALSGYATTSQLAGYLPLTGGTLTGSLTLYTSGSGATPALTFQKGSIGDEYWDWRVYNTYGHLFFQIYKDSWETFAEFSGTSGCISSNGFAKSNSNDNYVLLGGGGHALISSLSVAYASMIPNNIYVTTTDTQVDNGIGFFNGTRKLLFGTGTSGNSGLYVYNVGWVVGVNSSGNVFLNGNANSATVLQTARTIWGQSFNGSADVSGNMTNVGTISSSVFTTVKNSSVAYLVVESVYSTTYSDYIDIRVNQNSRPLVLQGSGGSVGIGTEHPLQKLHVAGSVYATSFIKSDGTSSQFLKADGSLDSNTYATTTQLGDYVPKTGGTMTGNLTVSGTNEPSIIVQKAGVATDQLLIGSSGNHGLYTVGIGFWCYIDTSNNAYFKGNADTATTASSCSGNAATATALQISRTIWGQSFDGTGNVDGKLVINASGYGQQLTVKRSDSANDAVICYENSSERLGIIGVSASKQPYFSPDDGNTIQWIWTSGNDGSGSGLDADLLDGQHGTYYATAASLNNYLPLTGGTMTGTIYFNNMQSGRDAGMNVTLGSRNAVFGIGTSGNIGIWHYVKGWAIGIDTSNNVFLHGNADTATTLQTPRTLWGQSFDGSGNVSGTITSSNFAIRDSSTNPYLNLPCGSYNWYVQSMSDGMYIGRTSTASLKIDASGNVLIVGRCGIGASSTSYKLYVAGTFGCDNTATFGSNVISGTSGGAIEGFQSWELNTHNTAGTNIGGFLDFHYNGTAQDYSVRLIEKDYSGVLQILAKDAGTGNAQRAGLIVGEGTYTSFIQIGNGRIVWNDSDHALRIVDKDGNACNLYATGGISALGYQSGGGGGGTSGVFSTSITPDTTGVYDLGTSTYKWRNLYLAGANGGNGFSIITSYSSYVYIGSLNKILFGADVEFEDTAYVENRMGIGVKNGNYDLYVYGENEGNAYFAGNVSVASLTNRSDMRLKDVVGDVNLSVQQIASAPTFKFRFKEKAKRTMVGTSAQYWDAVLPESVTRDADGILGLDYGVTALISTIILAKGMTEHERRITKLEMENAELRARIKDLEEN